MRVFVLEVGHLASMSGEPCGFSITCNPGNVGRARGAAPRFAPKMHDGRLTVWFGSSHPRRWVWDFFIHFDWEPCCYYDPGE